MKYSINIALAVILPMLLISCNKPVKKETPRVEVLHANEDLKYGIKYSDFRVESREVEEGDYFGSIMYNLSISDAELLKIIKAGEDKFDVTKIKVGDRYDLLYALNRSSGNDSLGFDKRPDYLVYKRDAINRVIFRLKDSLDVELHKIDTQRKMRYSDVVINSSLWNDLVAADCSPRLAVELSDIYDCTIDFFGLQKGDSFRVVYDEIYSGDDYIGLGDIYYAEFGHDSTLFKAVKFIEEGKGSKYWNEKGESLKKAFLKAPLNYTRISSGFTYARKHPILKIVRPHTGIDYAAPSGTPVVSIGDGVVISKKWDKGGGNVLKIKHTSAYTSVYMHLRGYAKGIKVGKRVAQGEEIGYVGSTGLSTGPHLDFRIYKNGTPINPLKMESPSIEPISKDNMEELSKTIERNLYRVDSLDASVHLNSMLRFLTSD